MGPAMCQRSLCRQLQNESCTVQEVVSKNTQSKDHLTVQEALSLSLVFSRQAPRSTCRVGRGSLRRAWPYVVVFLNNATWFVGVGDIVHRYRPLAFAVLLS